MSLDIHPPGIKVVAFKSLQIAGSLLNKTQITLSTTVESLLFVLLLTFRITFLLAFLVLILPVIVLLLLHLAFLGKSPLSIEHLLALVSFLSACLLKLIGVLLPLLLELGCELSCLLEILGHLGDTLFLLFERLLDQEVVTDFFLLLILLGVHLVDARSEVGRVTSKRNIHQLEELVHA